MSTRTPRKDDWGDEYPITVVLPMRIRRSVLLSDDGNLFPTKKDIFGNLTFTQTPRASWPAEGGPGRWKRWKEENRRSFIRGPFGQS